MASKDTEPRGILSFVLVWTAGPSVANIPKIALRFIFWRWRHKINQPVNAASSSLIIPLRLTVRKKMVHDIPSVLLGAVTGLEPDICHSNPLFLFVFLVLRKHLQRTNS